MIGVVANEEEYPDVREFFELFKTPWEFYSSDHDYDVVICSGKQWIEASAKLILIFGGQDDVSARPARSSGQQAVRSQGGDRMPIYRGCSAISGKGDVLLTIDGSSECAGREDIVNGQHIVRLGYDLFHEIRHLLTDGQPVAEARVPTLELHICFLRELMLRCSIPILEIPPVPVGYRFIACLTHDVDHPAIRNHVFDHTMFGFLYRATIGSIIDFFRGRKSLRQLVLNGWAAFSLPLVYLGWIKDPWNQFSHWLEIEKGVSSTFFVIPNKGEPGVGMGSGDTAPKRAAKYDAADLAHEVRLVQKAGFEIGAHGIDAWSNPSSGRRELEKIASLTNNREMGIRMHWLYWDKDSALALEQAGFSYDSTCGYNETVGYRAGSLQVFRLVSAKRLMELPMHIMDTALFFDGYLDYSPKQARAAIQEMVEHAVRFGGVLTFNWHDRSIAPERLWDITYNVFLNELRGRGAWITNASQAVAWFRKRRCAEIDESAVEQGGSIKEFATSPDKLPGLRLQIHQNSRCSADVTPIHAQKEACRSEQVYPN
jgi:hypothetical protein